MKDLCEKCYPTSSHLQCCKCARRAMRRVAKLERRLKALPNAKTIHERVLALNAISAEAKRIAKRRAAGRAT